MMTTVTETSGVGIMMTRRHIWAWPVLVLFQVAAVLGVCSCEGGKTGPSKQSKQKGASPMSITVTSEAFSAGGAIPRQYTGEGRDISPPLRWSGAPAETQQYVLICDDPDAPGGTWVHWVMYGIPPSVSALRAAVEASPRPSVPGGAVQGINSFRKVGYGGPMPPSGHGAHHYHFKVYALDAPLELEPRLSKAEVLEAIEGHILAWGELVGTYERK